MPGNNLSIIIIIIIAQRKEYNENVLIITIVNITIKGNVAV